MRETSKTCRRKCVGAILEVIQHGSYHVEHDPQGCARCCAGCCRNCFQIIKNFQLLFRSYTTLRKNELVVFRNIVHKRFQREFPNGPLFCHLSIIKSYICSLPIFDVFNIYQTLYTMDSSIVQSN
ncbi:Hypothetical_protein [Hexamita inflata]|uniref:Hypothetical_protein n=1 Tax=Hexamita inflata TaxID=28002 RepID=A0AA86U5I7_9EUKA|nr:Hypothetical protein HINF_LOCUS29369 [Hexamita inflata]